MEWDPPGDLPDPGIDPESPVLACGFFTTEPPGRAELFLTDCQAQEQHESFRSELCGTTVTQPGSFLLLHQLRGTSSVPPCLWGQVPERVSCDFRKREHQCPEQPQALPPEPAPFPSPFSSPLLPSPLPSPPLLGAGPAFSSETLTPCPTTRQLQMITSESGADHPAASCPRLPWVEPTASEKYLFNLL